MSKKIGLQRKIDTLGRGRVSTAATIGGVVIAPPSGGGGGAVPANYVQQSVDFTANHAVYAIGANTIASEAQLALARGGTAADLSATVGLLKQATAGAAVTVGTLTDTEHGTRGGGTLHAEATTSIAGFLSALDKTKLDSVTSGASVSSVALALPSIFSVTGSPVTTSGTLTATLATQTANTVFAGPSTGSPAAPTFRALAKADLPSAIAYEDEANTFTANQTIDSGTSLSQLSINRSTDANINQIRWTTNNSLRWLARTSELETGSNAGCIWQLVAYNDSGVFLWRPLWIERENQRIGINTATPAAMLDVNGTFQSGLASFTNGLRNGDTITTPTTGQYVARRQTSGGGIAAQTNMIDLRHQSTGTPAAGFGIAMLQRLQSTTTVDRDASAIRTAWSTATDASRAAYLAFSVYDFNAEREVIRIGASGTAGLLSFFAGTPVVRQTLAAAATDLASVVTLANSLRTALINYNLGV